MVNGDDEGVKGHKGDYHDDDGEGDEDDGDDYDGGSSSDGDDVGSVMIIAWLPCITGRPRGRSWPGLSEQLHPLHTNMLHNAQLHIYSPQVTTHKATQYFRAQI